MQKIIMLHSYQHWSTGVFIPNMCKRPKTATHGKTGDKADIVLKPRLGRSAR